MRINIKGNNPITSEQFKKVIDDLNAEYAPMGLKVKNMTCYVRFVDENTRVLYLQPHGEKYESLVDSVL